ncbi:MAG: 5,6-dimethylbenzimidazole synthase, partial [Acidimicrobiales bacterium]
MNQRPVAAVPLLESSPDGQCEVIHRRRDVRGQFNGEPIEPDVLRWVLEAAHAAPSLGVVVTYDRA